MSHVSDSRYHSRMTARVNSLRGSRQSLVRTLLQVSWSGAMDRLVWRRPNQPLRGQSLHLNWRGVLAAQVLRWPDRDPHDVRRQVRGLLLAAALLPGRRVSISIIDHSQLIRRSTCESNCELSVGPRVTSLWHHAYEFLSVRRLIYDWLGAVSFRDVKNVFFMFFL